MTEFTRIDIKPGKGLKITVGGKFATYDYLEGTDIVWLHRNGSNTVGIPVMEIPENLLEGMKTELIEAANKSGEEYDTNIELRVDHNVGLALI